MLQMLSDLDLALPAFDHTGCGRARSVIGYYNLKIPVGLAPKRPQHRFECIFAVVGSHNDGKQFTQVSASLPTPMASRFACSPARKITMACFHKLWNLAERKPIGWRGCRSAVALCIRRQP
jgi:hypothetical protein